MKSILIKYLNYIILLVSSVSYANSFDVNIYTLGKKQLILSSGFEASIDIFDKVEHKDYRSWKTKLVLRKNSKVIFERFPIDSDAHENSHFYFVPISNNKYLVDLDGDNKNEFAVVYDHGGNAPATSVMLFTVKKENLKLFKTAWYAMEGGNSVIWSKQDVPRKCLFVRDNVCEYL